MSPAATSSSSSAFSSALALGWHLDERARDPLRQRSLRRRPHAHRRQHFRPFASSAGYARPAASPSVLLIATVGARARPLLLDRPPARRPRSPLSSSRTPPPACRCSSPGSRSFPSPTRFGVDSAAQRAQEALAATAGYLFTSIPNWLSHLFDHPHHRLPQHLLHARGRATSTSTSSRSSTHAPAPASTSPSRKPRPR